MDRKAIGTVFVAALVLAGGPASMASGQPPPERYPSRPIRLIQPFPPGGGADVAARFVAQQISEKLGQTVVVDNRGGAGGAIGTEIAAQSAPDGYTLLMATVSTIVINPLVNRVRFDPIRDFDPVVHVSTVPLILVVHPSVPAKSVRELINLARAQPGKINFASSGEGTISHLAGELFKILTATDLVHVPYRGGGPARTALIAGEVQVNFGNMLASAADVRAGRLRALAVSTPRRTDGMPEVPTLQEAGVPQYEVLQWSGILAPRGAPASRIELVNREVNRVLATQKAREFFLAGGSEPGGGSPQAFGALIRSDIAKWSQIVKQVKISSGLNP
ncbi:MAG TPA: tripartite tricarboxylate transporter substrate binding protein [Burkholderiales bacterium]|nr:tripartite tricarboxylate transporter substrate binding protein [Burkholderiales bacterium]